jgi:hypothetical protein
VFDEMMRADPKEFKNFEDGKWLSSDNFDSFFDLMNTHVRLNRLKCFLASSTKLYAFEKLSSRVKKQKKLERFRKKIGLHRFQNVSTIIASIFASDHWQLAQFHKDSRKIYTYCSLGWRVRISETIKNFVTFALQENVVWQKPEVIQGPKQKNSYDCGIFSMSAAWCWCTGKSLKFRQSDINQIRSWFRHVISKQLDPLSNPPHFAGNKSTNLLPSSQLEIIKQNGPKRIYEQQQLPQIHENLTWERLLCVEGSTDVMQNEELQVKTFRCLESFCSYASSLNQTERTNLFLNSNVDGIFRKLELRNFYDGQGLIVTIDIDSILFSTEYLEPTEDVLFFPFPNRHATLTKKNHMTWFVGHQQYPLSAIPNYQIATTGHNSVFHINIFFPRKMNTKNNKWVNFVLSEDLELFYNEAILPTIVDVLPCDEHREFPTSYKNAMSKATTRKGTFHFFTKAIGKSFTKHFFTRLRQIVNENERLVEFREMFYHVHAKDLKLVMRNYVENPIEMMKQQYDVFNWKCIKKESLFLDIGLEFNIPKELSSTLLWNANFLSSWMKTSRISVQNRHPWCQLKDVGGANGTAYKSLQLEGCIYFQAYQLEKSILYSYQNGGSSRFSLHDVKNGSALFQSCMNSWKEAWNSSLVHQMSFGTRAEWRLQITSASTLLQTTPSKETLASFITANSLYIAKTSTVVLFKQMYLESICAFRDELPSWPLDSNRQLILYALCHFLLKNLQSSTQQMNSKIEKMFFIQSNRQQFGMALLTNIDFQEKTIEIEQKKADELSKFFNQYSRHSITSAKRNRTLLDERIEEKTKMPISGKQMFQIFLNDLWQCMPAPATYLKKPLPDSAPMFTDNSIEEFVSSFQISKSRTNSWSDRFRWFFPENLESSCDQFISKQGWKQLTYINTYWQWLATASDEDKLNLRKCFMEMNILPASIVTDKLWRTTKLKTHGKTVVLFCRKPDDNKSNETIENVQMWYCKKCFKKFKRKKNGDLSKTAKNHKIECQ